MEVLLALLALGYLLGLPVAVIVLLVGHSRLKHRLAALEMRVAEGWMAAPAATPVPEEAPRAVEPTLPVGPGTAADASPPAIAAPPAEVVLPAPAPETADQDRPLVVRRDRLSQLVAWVSDNWVYLVSAVSLAAAGVFFVQYGIETGLLSPAARVLLAVLFGLALVAAGEWVRRRQQGAEDAAAHLPAVFSGAGLVSVFAGVVAGRLLYGLYGPEVTFAGLAATAALAIGLGWRNEAFLVAVGLIGSSAAPFLVGSEGGAPAWLYGYYGLVAVIGLSVDALRRWAWVSVLALVIGYGFGFLMLQSGAGVGGWILLLAGLACAAVAIPTLSLRPEHEPPAALPWLAAGMRAPWPAFPVRLAAGAALASSVLLTLVMADTPAEAWLAFLALAVLALAFLLWADRAPGLDDLALYAALAFLARLVLEGHDGVLGEMFRAQAIALRPPETDAPWTMTGLLVMAAAISVASAQRALAGDRFRLVFGAVAATVAPVAALVLERFWTPAQVLGPFPWALHVMALAALMVALALRFAARDGADRRRTAYATLAALSLIALALFIVAAGEALTLALAVLVVVTAGLDRRFGLPELGVLVQVGVVVLGWRIAVNPGVDWALAAALLPMLAVYAGVIAALVGALVLLWPRDRVMAKGMLESGAAGAMALFANVLIARALGYSELISWSGRALDLSLNAMPWLILMLVQLYRMPLGGPLRRLRAGLAGVAGLIAGVALAAAAGPANPLLGDGSLAPIQPIRGPLILDTLLVTYLLPGALLLAAPRLIPSLPPWLRYVFLGAGSLLAALYTGLEIRRVWRGDILSLDGVTQPELFSYTIALTLAGAALLYQAIAKRSPGLRRIAMALIALTIAKVFLVDASGLTGLTRVVSFLGLGLSLAGLAWLNRWAGAQAGKSDAKAG